MLASVKPDIVMDNESWLKPIVKNCEVFTRVILIGIHTNKTGSKHVEESS